MAHFLCKTPNYDQKGTHTSRLPLPKRFSWPTIWAGVERKRGLPLRLACLAAGRRLCSLRPKTGPEPIGVCLTRWAPGPVCIIR